MSDEKINDPRVAYAHVGLDGDFTFFKCYTQALTDPETKESGRFEVSYQNYFPLLEKHSDPVGWLKLAVIAQLAKCVRDTGVPVEKWIVEFSPVMVKFNVPSHLFLDTARDRNWLV